MKFRRQGEGGVHVSTFSRSATIGAAVALLTGLLPAAVLAETYTIYYNAATHKLIETLPRKARAGDTVQVKIINPNTFREQYRLKYTETNFHTATVPTALQPFFASSKASETSGFSELPTPTEAQFAALDTDNSDEAKALFNNMAVVEGKPVGPRMKALFERLRVGHQFQLHLAAHARYYALIQHMDRDILEIVATRRTNNEIRYEVGLALWYYFAAMAEADPIATAPPAAGAVNPVDQGDVFYRVPDSRIKGELPREALLGFYAKNSNRFLFKSMQNVFGPADLEPEDPKAPAGAKKPKKPGARSAYPQEEVGDFTAAQVDELRALAGKVSHPVTYAAYFVKVADREVHLPANEMVRLWTQAIATNKVGGNEKVFNAFYAKHVAPLQNYNKSLSTAYMTYLTNLAPGFTAAAALCERVMDRGYTPGVIEDGKKVGSSADVFEVSIQQVPDVANLKALASLATTAPPLAAGAPPLPADPPADAPNDPAGTDNSKRVPEAVLTTSTSFDVQREDLFDFSTGLTISGLQDQDKYKKHSRAAVDLTAFGHYYLRGMNKPAHLLGADALGLTLGAPLSQNTNLDHFMVGLSLVYGRRNRVIVSFGQELGKVNRQVKAGSTATDGTVTDPEYNKLWDNKWFLGISFALNL